MSAIEPSAASLPPTDLVMPQIPPIWYPPIYPPYGIDPFHFFIDLRVSGQIYDRKKETNSPATNIETASMTENNNQIGKIRHGSAFTVPRRNKSPSALNLTSSPITTTATKPSSIDFINNNCFENDEKFALSRNTNYVLQNLPRIYTSLTTNTTTNNNNNGDDRQSLQSDESDCKSGASDIDVKNNNEVSNQSDDVVIVDQDSDRQSERRHVKR